MATQKLTAQQKRDREAMRLFSETFDKLRHEHQIELAKHGNENYSLGVTQGELQARYKFSRLSMWQRLRFRP